MMDSAPHLPTADRLGVLTEAECRRLLATHTLGRVGMTSGGLPCILPVCYLYDDGAIVFRTGPDTKLRAAESGDVLAFEVDRFDRHSGKGWSVLVQGRASVLAVDDGDEADGDQYIRLQCELLTGRVTPAETPGIAV
jgi:nitroimidazol reductase NimA-like FMN-containing flavoprotein (pyridoxamine 5'-phosphate oxidase superfamily)